MTLPSAVKRSVWAALSTASALLLFSFFCHALGVPAGALLIALAVLTAFRPYESLLILAALTPLSTMLFVVLGVKVGGLRGVEALTLAYLAGWAMRRAIRPDELCVPPALRLNATGLVVAALASAVVTTRVLFAQNGTGLPASFLDEWFRSYAVNLNPVTTALAFAQGVLLMLAVADVCAGSPARRDGAVRMMVVGAAAAALFNVLRLLIDGALPSEEPLRRFLTLIGGVRVNVHHGDLNAAGSYFALTWFLALGLTRHRLARAICLVLISAGLWTAGSRVSIAATLLLGALILVHRVFRRHTRKMIFAGVLLTVIAAHIVWMFPAKRHAADSSLALRIRMGLAVGAIAMAADHPLFGVGLGQFYGLSDKYVHVPNYIVRENAHNNFLQVLAELGLPGLFLFLAVLASALSTLRNESDATAWSAAGGICAFLLTSIAGHPLLVPLAAMPFWMALGLAGSFPGRPAHPLVRTIAVALSLFFIITLPLRLTAAVRTANLENVTAGFSAWQHLEDGQRFRWAGGQAMFHVPSSARLAAIPLRHGGGAAPRLQVRILVDGRDANRVELEAGGDWSIVRIMIPKSSKAEYTRIELHTSIPGTSAVLGTAASNDAGVLMVGRPEIRY